jgi:hypothetical protein
VSIDVEGYLGQDGEPNIFRSDLEVMVVAVGFVRRHDKAIG